MASRYWAARVYGASSAGYLSLTELQLLDAQGQRVDEGALLASDAPLWSGSAPLSALGDGATTAQVSWIVSNTNGAVRVTWDLGAPAAVATVRIGGASATETPTRATLYASDDGEAWQLMATLVIDYPGNGVLSGPIPVVSPIVAAPLPAHTQLLIPTALSPDAAIVVQPPVIDVLGASVADPNAVPTAPIPAAQSVDLDNAGRGNIYGTVKIKGEPDLPVARRVYLLREPQPRVIAETMSDAATGEYAFNALDEQRRYTVLSFDPTHDKRAVIADNIAPKPGAAPLEIA